MRRLLLVPVWIVVVVVAIGCVVAITGFLFAVTTHAPDRSGSTLMKRPHSAHVWSDHLKLKLKTRGVASSVTLRGVANLTLKNKSGRAAQYTFGAKGCVATAIFVEVFTRQGAPVWRSGGVVNKHRPCPQFLGIKSIRGGAVARWRIPFHVPGPGTYFIRGVAQLTKPEVALQTPRLKVNS
jgi:hypothetical protein